MFIRENDFLTHEMANEIFDCELLPFLDDLILGYLESTARKLSQIGIAQGLLHIDWPINPPQTSK